MKILAEEFLQQFKVLPHTIDIPKWQAHRGYWLEGAAQNSLTAFRAAYQLGFRMFEMDAQVTADGEVFLAHDRWTKLDDGEVLLPKVLADRLSKSFTRLEDVVWEFSDCILNIELKLPPILGPSLERAVADILDRHHAWDRVVISSFSPLALWRIKQIHPTAALAALVDEGRWDWLRLKAMLALRPSFLHLHNRLLHKLRLPSLRPDWRVVVWTVNDRDEAERWLRSGAVSIISDKKLF